MKVKIICKSVIASHSIYSDVHYGVNQGSTGAAAIENFIKDAMKWFGYEKDYEKTLEITMKDISQAMRFFTPRQWGICGHDADRKFIVTEYPPIKNFMDKQHKICKDVINAINNKYENNKYNLAIEDKCTPEFILEPEDFFHDGDDLNSFGTVKFIFSIFPESHNTAFYIYQDEYNEKLKDILNTYHLEESFEISEKIKKEICPLFETFWFEGAFELFKKSYKDKLIDKMDDEIDGDLKKIGEKFKEKYPKFVEKFEINFQKTLDVRVEYPLNDSDIEEITVNENKSVL